MKKVPTWATHLEQAWRQAPHHQTCDSIKLSHVFGYPRIGTVQVGTGKYRTTPQRVMANLQMANICQRVANTL